MADKGADLTMRADFAEMIQPFVSTEEIRYHLNGFYVEKHPKIGALIVATDGRVLGVLHDETAECRVPGIIRLSKSTLSACKRKKEDEDAPRLVVKGDHAAVYADWNADTGEGRVIAAQDEAVIDGAFPEWRKVIPPFPNKHEPATFNLALLKKFEKVRGPYDGKVVPFRIFTTDDTTPAIVLTDLPEFFGVIVPVRYHNSTHSRIPTWLGPVGQAA